MTSALVPLAPDFEELEAVTIVDLLRRAGIEVVTASLGERTVRASRGTVLVADATLDDVRDRLFDVVVLPGGLPGADRLRDDPRVIDILHRHADADRYTAAICAAPKVLAEAGLLDGRSATSYPGVLEALDLPETRLTASAVERDGKVVTSRGPGTAMDFALALIEALLGARKRKEVESALCRPAVS